MTEWKDYRLGELIEVINGYAFKSSNFLGGKRDDALPVIKIKNVANGDVHLNDCQYHLFDSSLERFKVRKGDILIALTGNHPEVMTQVVGEVSRFKLDKEALLNQRVAKLVAKSIDDKFLYYFLKDDNTHDYLASQSAGSANQANISKSDIESVQILLPPPQEQKNIGEVLSSLDDKIDLLHRQNKTLEQLAVTLFRQLFVEEVGNVDSISLEDLVETVNGVSYKSSELNPSKIAMVSLKSFDRNGGFRIDGFKEFTGKFKEKQVVREGDLIVAHTDITQEAEVIGNPALVIGDSKYNTLVISMDMVKVIPLVDWISTEFLYFLMKTREFKGHCEGLANGSTVLHLSKSAIPTFQFSKPDFSKVKEFSSNAKAIIRKTFNNHSQIKSLISLRDALLPKLMSGVVRIN